MRGLEKKLPVAYVPFKTFLAAIDRFDRQMPHQIDSSLWPSYSGAIRSQLIGSFKFLGLIDGEGRPTASLRNFVQDKSNRKANLRKILQTSYKPILAAEPQKLTPRQFQELMLEFGGMTGSTHKKVVSFFIQAAKFSGLPIGVGFRRRNSIPTKKPSPSIELVNDGEKRLSANGVSKSVNLQSGGQITLALSGSLLDLSPGDRDFVFEIIDKLKSYRGSPE